MPSDREALLVTKRFKFPVPSADGTRLEVREFQPGEFLPRQAWDLAPARSRRAMANTGFVRDPLTVEINQVTGQADPVPVGKPSRTVLLPPTTVLRDGQEKVIHGVDALEADREARAAQTRPPSGTRLNPKVWGDRQQEAPADRPRAQSGTRLNPKVWGEQTVAPVEVARPTPKRRGRPPKQKA